MAVQHPHSNPSPTRNLKLPCLSCSILAFVVLLCTGCGTGLFILSEIKDLNNSPFEITGIFPINRSVPSYPLSADQRAVIDQFGYPDSFTILFYDETFGGTTTRLETWIYSSQGYKYTFVNGANQALDHFETLTGEIIASPYQPEQFHAYMSLEDLLAVTKIDEFLLLPLEKELVPGGESYFADRLAFGLKDGELMYLEVISFEYSEENAASEADPEREAEDAQDQPATPIVEAELQEDSPIGSQGNPFVYVSQRNDPNWPGCESSGQGCRSELFVYYPDGTGLVEFSLTNTAGFQSVSTPAISHSGRWVAFSGVKEDYADLYIIDIDGKNLQRITTQASEDWNPVWSPADDQLAFVSNRDGVNRQNIFIIDLDSGEITQISSGKYWDRNIDWSPDGDLLAFNSDRADPNAGNCFPDCAWNLFLLDIHSAEIAPFPDGIGRDSAGITWSPDGNMMAFHSLVYDQYDLMLIDRDFNVIQFTHTAGANEVHPAWSPDGTRLVFSSDQNGNIDIATTPITEFKPTFLTEHPAADYYPDW